MFNKRFYTQAVLKFLKLNTQAQQREAIVQGRSLSPYRLRYNEVGVFLTICYCGCLVKEIR
ncbi:MAG: hypothetical protein LBJ00_14435 [Planctomycetaceae bacterium]|nr:hypothetical protein [Planctomycetaceae bacterium]